MPAPNMAQTVRRFGVPVTLRTWTADTQNAEGFLVPGTPTDTTITMHVYPAPGEVVDRLPEGLKSSNVQMGGTPDVVAAPVPGQRGSEIITNGRTYEVIAVQEWVGGSTGAVAYRECTLVEVNR